jgi:signal transduction histidine kinase
MDLQPGLPKVRVDRLRVQHVLFTLTQNAFEACAPVAGARPTVRIGTHGDRYGVEVSVLDPGPGIAPEHRAQIFHPFFTTKSAGTGLGLASARAIIEAHQGTIGFDATGGTRFWFKLPASEQQ